MSTQFALKLRDGIDVVFVPVEDLKPNPLQPKFQRTSEGQIKRLREDIIETRYIAPLTVTHKHVICDGHRRWTVARTLGVKSVPCVVMREDAAMLFIRLNAGIMKPSGKTYLTAWALSDDRPSTLEHLPKTPAKQISRLVDLLGVPYVTAMGREEREGPGVVIWIDKVVANLSNRGLKITEAAVAKWMIDHSMQGQILVLLRKDATRREWGRLHRAVLDDVPFAQRGRGRPRKEGRGRRPGKEA